MSFLSRMSHHHETCLLFFIVCYHLCKYSYRICCLFLLVFKLYVNEIILYISVTSFPTILLEIFPCWWDDWTTIYSFIFIKWRFIPRFSWLWVMLNNTCLPVPICKSFSRCCYVSKKEWISGLQDITRSSEIGRRQTQYSGCINLHSQWRLTSCSCQHLVLLTSKFLLIRWVWNCMSLWF